MRLNPADEQLLRWYCLEWSGEHLRSSFSIVVGRATGEIPPSNRSSAGDTYSDEALARVRVANKVRQRLTKLPKRLRRALMAAYVQKRPSRLEQAFARLACVVLLLPSVRAAYRKAQDRQRASGLPFERWVVVTAKLDKDAAARFGDEADKLLSEAATAWQKTRIPKRPTRARS